LQKNNKFQKRKNVHKVLNETKKILIARDHLTKEEIKEYSILYVMYNYPEIISPRLEILKILFYLPRYSTNSNQKFYISFQKINLMAKAKKN